MTCAALNILCNIERCILWYFGTHTHTESLTLVKVFQKMSYQSSVTLTLHAFVVLLEIKQFFVEIFYLIIRSDWYKQILHTIP